MKAKEYIEKYKACLESGDHEAIRKAGADMMFEFSQEAENIMKSRGIKRDSAALAVLKEQNTKWNAVVKAFPIILKHDGFKVFWMDRMPEIKKVWR